MSTTPDEEIDDPGRDPEGLAVPRNPLAGADQDSGQGDPRGGDGGAPGDNDVAAGGVAQP